MALSQYVFFLGHARLILHGGANGCKEQRWSRGHKARGHGQGQEHKKISRPRTDPLEAKAKDQGHRRKCSPKKKGPQNFFSGDLKKKVLKIFFQAIST